MDMNLISYETVVKDLEAHPAKRIFWRSGWAWKGAGEGEVSRDPKDYPRRMVDKSIGCVLYCATV
jgi:hypothetical protein